MSFLTAIVGSVLSGIGSRSEGRRQARQSREERNHDFRLAEYEGLLADALRQRQRSEIARGWDNWNNPAGKPNRDPVALPRLSDYLNKG